MKIGAKIYYYNYKMRERRKELNFTIRQVADLCGTYPNRIGDIEGLRPISINYLESVKSLMFKIADLFEIDMEILFPQEYIQALTKGWHAIPRGFVRDVSLECLPPGTTDEVLMLPSPEEEADSKKLRAEMEKLLTTLPPREARVLILRYGFHNQEVHTLETTAKIMGVTRERIRQIEAVALSRLRHPATRRKLNDYR